MNLLSSPGVFYALIAVFLAGAIGSLLFRRSDSATNIWGGSLAAIGSLTGLLFAGASLLHGSPATFSLSTSFPLLTLSFRLDRLSAFFMLIVCFVALICSVYAIGYVRHYYGKYSVGVLGFFYNIFIASMILVTTVHNALFFLIAWEVMSLASYFLVIYESRQSANIRAGSFYFIMTHTGTAFIIVSFLLMYKVTGSFDFEIIAAGLAGASAPMKNAIFLTALIGFGVKAGIIPLHIWLPGAHPAAPSHVSALMSGVMIKTGVYMLIRTSLDILAASYFWWGIALLAIGAASSLLGVLYALSEHDLKRLLAYHSIENIGIILLGLGSAVVFSSAGKDSLAILAIAAALFHTLNHATFKALLFLGAGSVIATTHTRNIEKYGGLIRYMPLTALFFLIGSMAISALPPLNGFFSEWLTFQAMFQGVTAFGLTTRIVFILAIGSLAFTGGLAAACFVKAFGVTFLARPRGEAITAARESSILSRLAMAGMSTAIIGLGLFSGVVTRLLESVAVSLGSLHGAALPGSAHFQSISMENGFARISMPVVFTSIAVAAIAVTATVYSFTRKRKTITGPTWNCGTRLTPRMEITATGFSRSIVTVMRGVLRPSSETEIEYHDANRYFPKIGTVTMGLRDIYQPFIYRPLRELTATIARHMRKVQGGNVNAYILYIFLTLIGLLILLDLGS